MKIEVVGRHPKRRFGKRVGPKKTQSIIRLSQRALLEGEIISLTSTKMHILHNSRLFVFRLEIDYRDGEKKLFIKTVMTENEIKESATFYNGYFRENSQYKKSRYAKSNFELCA
ncbi:MAG: hypothetical protein PHE67_00505 [Campylobacterales bacterium]|nr:hypothetical protein [Campylobacterales bacterium]